MWDEQAGKLQNHFLKTKWPHYAVKCTFSLLHKTRVPRTISVADKDNSIWAALSNDGNYTAVSPTLHTHIYGLENDRQNAKVFKISDGYNVTSRL